MLGADQTYPATFAIDHRHRGMLHQIAAVHAWDPACPGALVVGRRALDWSAESAEPFEHLGRHLNAGWIAVLPMLTPHRYTTGGKPSRRDRYRSIGLAGRLSIAQRATQVSDRSGPGMAVVWAYGRPPAGWDRGLFHRQAAELASALAHMTRIEGLQPVRSLALDVRGGHPVEVSDAVRGGLVSAPTPWAPVAPRR